MISVTTGLKLLVQLGLFLLFLFDYGLPSIKKYLEGKTIRIKSKEETGGIEAPSITIAVWNKGTGFGWLNKSEDIVHHKDSLRHQCKGFNNIVECIRNQTYKQSDFLKDIVIGNPKKVSLLESSATSLIEDFTNVRFGRTYTFDPNRRIGPDSEKDEIILILDPNLVYSVILHDKRFFVMSENPFGIPTVYIKIDPSTSFGPYYTIDVTHQKNLNLADAPCEENTEYDFNLCVKQSLSKKIGCRLAWDSRSDGNIRECTTMEEYHKYELVFYQMRHEEFQVINSLTDCARPCQYNEYRLLAEKRPTSFETKYFPIAFTSRTRTTTNDHEELLYTWESLVADVGGLLGLFLGFSFMTLWDGLIWTRQCWDSAMKKCGKSDSQAISVQPSMGL